MLEIMEGLQIAETRQMLATSPLRVVCVRPPPCSKGVAFASRTLEPCFADAEPQLIGRQRELRAHRSLERKRKLLIVRTTGSGWAVVLEAVAGSPWPLKIKAALVSPQLGT
jgi:hypothetical protein